MYSPVPWMRSDLFNQIADAVTLSGWQQQVPVGSLLDFCPEVSSRCGPALMSNINVRDLRTITIEIPADILIELRCGQE